MAKRPDNGRASEEDPEVKKIIEHIEKSESEKDSTDTKNEDSNLYRDIFYFKYISIKLFRPIIPKFY